VDDEERLQSILPHLEAIMGSGLITMERARVLLYRSS
jgi:PII-like signaling protein